MRCSVAEVFLDFYEMVVAPNLRELQDGTTGRDED